jgi:hypothetical protein
LENIVFYRYYLAGVTLQNCYSTIHVTFIKIGNFIQVRDLKHKQIVSLLQGSATEHNDETYHSSVQRMSLGKALKGVGITRRDTGVSGHERHNLIFPQLRN